MNDKQAKNILENELGLNFGDNTGVKYIPDSMADFVSFAKVNGWQEDQDPVIHYWTFYKRFDNCEIRLYIHGKKEFHFVVNED